MEGLKRSWKQLVYIFSTEDHYAEYNPEDVPDTSGSVFKGLKNMDGSEIDLNGFSEGAEQGSIEGVSECLLAWRHIASWCNEHNTDLYATLGDPCTRNDILKAESDLSITFPAPVRASLYTHDGQDDVYAMQGVSGLIYGLKLMSLDEIVHMTLTWRSVASKLQAQAEKIDESKREFGTGQFSASVSSNVVNQKSHEKTQKSDQYDPVCSDKDDSENSINQFKLYKIPRQASIPPLAIQPVYAHSGWIPLVTDDAGNHIAIDLAPGPKGKYAQVIMFGRDFDTKFVIADNWGDFLLNFVNDLENGNWTLVDNTDDYLNGDGELKFIDKKHNSPILDYLVVLKKRSWIAWQKSKSVPITPDSSSNIVPTAVYTHSKKSTDSVEKVEVQKDGVHASTSTVNDVSSVNTQPNVDEFKNLKFNPNAIDNNKDDNEKNSNSGSITVSVTEPPSESIDG